MIFQMNPNPTLVETPFGTIRFDLFFSGEYCYGSSKEGRVIRIGLVTNGFTDVIYHRFPEFPHLDPATFKDHETLEAMDKKYRDEWEEFRRTLLLNKLFRPLPGEEMPVEVKIEPPGGKGPGPGGLRKLN